MTLSTAKLALRIVDPAGAHAEVELENGDSTIGRTATCNVVLQDAKASRIHARLHIEGDVASVEDLGSSNGTMLNGVRISKPETVRVGDEIRIGDSTIDVLPVEVSDETQVIASSEGDIFRTRVADGPGVTQVLAPVDIAAPAPRIRGLVPDDLMNDPIISEQALLDNGVPVKVCEYAALGGGMGSFVFVDLLRCSGVDAPDITVMGNEEKPYARYQRLCSNSQIPSHERLRSNSESCPDNVWGFPGYAVREAWRELTSGHIGAASSALWSIFGEPAISQTYTPRSGDVFRSIDREAARIGWNDMMVHGRIRRIRKTTEGRLLVVLSQSEGQDRKHVAVSAKYLHLAIGYPAIQLLPDLAEYRERYQDTTRVVNAYEEHDHVYKHLRANGGTVILRGRGIVASRVIQRLYEERAHNKNINIVHLHRSRLTSGHRYGASKRAVVADAEFQPFNWPKACWTGELREVLEEASDERRKELLEIWGGTTTARRGDWDQIIADGLREGWYRPEYGKILDVSQGSDGRVITRVQNVLSAGGTLELAVDYVIDCTGLIASPERSPLLNDLIQTYNLPRNALGRLRVTNDFEVEGMRHDDCRLYTAGAITLGGPVAAVDSFLGLQYAALRAVDHLRSAAPKGLRRLNGVFSVSQWWKWAKGIKP